MKVGGGKGDHWSSKTTPGVDEASYHFGDLKSFMVKEKKVSRSKGRGGDSRRW